MHLLLSSTIDQPGPVAEENASGYNTVDSRSRFGLFAVQGRESEMRFILGAILGAVAVIFFAQNVETVQIDLFFWTLNISRGIIFPALFVLGIIVGLVLGGIRAIARRRSAEAKK